MKYLSVYLKQGQVVIVSPTKNTLDAIKNVESYEFFNKDSSNNI